jgi:NAD(P)H-dependent FMN reductase
VTTILAISGSLRRLSTNTALLRTAQVIATPPVVVDIYTGMDELPHFNPDNDHDPLPPPVAALRNAIHRADALLLSTPEYAGALPGSFKNLLDWTIGDDQPGSIYEKPVGWINASSHGAINAQASLRLVLGFAHARIIDEACAEIPINSHDISDDGLVNDADVRTRLGALLAELSG